MLFSTIGIRKAIWVWHVVPFWVIVPRFLNWWTRQEHLISSLIASVTPEPNLFATSISRQILMVAQVIKPLDCLLAASVCSFPWRPPDNYVQDLVITSIACLRLQRSLLWNTIIQTKRLRPTHHKPQAQPSESLEFHRCQLQHPTTQKHKFSGTCGFHELPQLDDSIGNHIFLGEDVFHFGKHEIDSVHFSAFSSRTHRLSVDPQTLGEAVGQSIFYRLILSRWKSPWLFVCPLPAKSLDNLCQLGLFGCTLTELRDGYGLSNMVAQMCC